MSEPETTVGAGPDDRTVRGRVSFPTGTPPLAAVTLRISLQDVTRADAPARIVSEIVIHGVSFAGGDSQVTFEMRLDRVNPRTRYAVRAHADVDGDGRVSAGDYVTTQSYPVLTFEHGTDVDMRLQRVGGS